MIISAFIDGGFLRAFGEKKNMKWLNPSVLVEGILSKEGLGKPHGGARRITYYDATPGEGETTDGDLENYWAAVQRQPWTGLGWGFLDGKSNRRRQKAVDTLITIDMLTGAFKKNFELAVLVTGDADFVPVVQELQRLGVSVIVAAGGAGVSDELKGIADLFLSIDDKKLLRELSI